VNVMALAVTLGDLMLAVAALYVSGQALRGVWLERRAARAANDDDRNKFLTDARTFYVSASLSRPWVLVLVFAGTAIKLAAGLAAL